MRPKPSSSLVALVILRAGRRCEYCHTPQKLTGQSFHLDHILPISANGKTNAENLCLACPHCNSVKSDRVSGRDPKTGRIVRLFNPRKDKWEKHFSWADDWSELIGRTPIGRATIVVLRMNNALLREARFFWRLAGGIP